MFEQRKPRPPVVTILGDAGMGKTSLACTFPQPVVIRAEDGLQSIANPPPAGELIDTPDELWKQLKYLVVEKHDFKTVIIDSVTALDRIFVENIIATDPKKPRSINQALGGYGAGVSALASMHMRIRKATELLTTRGMTVVFIAHAETKKVEPPDAEPYTRYSLRLHEKSVAHYTDDVDVVAFLRLQSFVMGDDEKKRAVSDGTRELICHAVAANVSKNRYGISESLIVNEGENPLLPILYKGQTS